MQPSEQDNSVWISKEEYERLRALEQEKTAVPVVQSDVEGEQKQAQALRSQRTWQVILGGLLSVALYVSVVSGSWANAWIVAAIIIFGGVSLVDYIRSHQADESGQARPKPFRNNPYKLLVICFAAIALFPVIAFVGILIIFMTLGGGDVGS